MNRVLLVSAPRLRRSPATLFEQRCCFTSFVDRFSTTLAQRLTSLADKQMMPLSEQRITERRRPYPRRPSMQENLAERLDAQQRLRAHLVPSQVIVSKDRQYLDLVWPATALNAAEQQQQRVGEAAGGEARVKRRADEHRTRLLAEFLRAYSPSTDVIGADALVYGRRGIIITDVIPVGNYALRIVFSDGHSGGIYPYEYLLDLGRHKYARMREYIRRLRAKRKSRDPPRRAPSRRLQRGQNTSTGRRTVKAGDGSSRSNGDGHHGPAAAK
ncbi:Myb domain protein 40 [Trypanosoma grayi]|uniref:Myb domain protein 40 n=1 Tax=Trypanosoma grayi TaxID=71804 RepID=UPI0004F4039D|nr:Myb domain protein 40 [Trypanosoma grayi]KEG13220.1 Myb domain protein 40 [Trypanosoma grayi]